MKVPYTVIMLEETEDGPDFFIEVAKTAELDMGTAKAIRQAHDLFEQERPRVKVIGILRGDFADTWTPGSSVKEGFDENADPRQPA